MIEHQQVNLLWADDDCDGLLAPLGWRFDGDGFHVLKATNLADAREILEREQVDALLVDIILPHSSGTGTLGSNLGLKLAEMAASKGVKSICLLTVVQKGEVNASFERLTKEYPETRIAYFDKLILLEPTIVEKLTNSLKGRPVE